jgi:hypothetical protein
LNNHQLLVGLIFLALILTLWPLGLTSLRVFAYDPDETVKKIRKIRLLKPKTDKDCPYCQAYRAKTSTDRKQG